MPRSIVFCVASVLDFSLAFFYCSDFSTGVLREFLKHTILRGTDLFSLRWSNKQMTTANTTIAI